MPCGYSTVYLSDLNRQPDREIVVVLCSMFCYELREKRHPDWEIGSLDKKSQTRQEYIGINLECKQKMLKSQTIYTNIVAQHKRRINDKL